MTVSTISKNKIKAKTKDSFRHFKVFEEAREAITKLKTLKPFLSPQDEETLAILMDKELVAHLEKSLKEAESEKFEPLKNIL